MGIDKKDVRFVCHFNIPKSMEAFYQESGRAGRDQLPARSLLYYGVDDKRRMEFILKNTSSKQNNLNSKDGQAEKALQDFDQMVKYCESVGCRRKKILESFGEKVPTSLCGRTCDACKHPNMLAAKLEELAQAHGRHKNGLQPVFMKSLLLATGDLKTEFWNRDDEASDSDGEGISHSDDDEPKVNVNLASKKFPKMGLSEKVDCLLRAEEAQNSKIFKKQVRHHNQACHASDKKGVSTMMRDASKERLLNALKQAHQRLGEPITEPQSAAVFLENECYEKYGKAGKSFYSSQVASTVRWLSTTTSAEMKTRLGSSSVFENENLVTVSSSNFASASCFIPMGSGNEDTTGLDVGTKYQQGTHTSEESIDVSNKTELANRELVPSHLDFGRRKGKNGLSNLLPISSTCRLSGSSRLTATREDGSSMIEKRAKDVVLSEASASKYVESGALLPRIPSFSEFASQKERVNKSKISMSSFKPPATVRNIKESESDGRSSSDKRAKLN